jgi:oligopeptide/dipeptide ABC transporter ATP-binding protein
MHGANGGEPLLRVEGLRTYFYLGRGKEVVRAVDGVSFDLAAGRTLGIVGESGSGKSVTARSVLRIVERPGRIVGGRIVFRGRDLLGLPEREMRRIRGGQIAMIFQNPAASLNPTYTFGNQLIETIHLHTGAAGRDAERKAIASLELVGVPDPEHVLRLFPFELSAGMVQRIMIAFAISCDPQLILADEPTTTLDVTVQAQILRSLAHVQRELGTALILISHNFGVVSQMADDIMVMYAGICVEYGPKRDLLLQPLQPYTQALIRSVPAAEGARPQRLQAIPGFPPDLSNLPPGCPFAPRCPRAQEVCRRVRPELELAGASGRQKVACHFPGPWEGS